MQKRILIVDDDPTVRLIADKSELDELCCGVSNLLNGPTGALVQNPLFGNGKIYPGTERAYWLHVPAQYDPAKPACLMVFSMWCKATKKP